MNRLAHLFLSVVLCAVSVSAGLWPSLAISDQTIQVVKIAGQEKTAVVRLPNGKLKVIHAGDTLASVGKVTSISDGRISITNKKNETLIIRSDTGEQVVNRISKVDPTADSALRTTTLAPEKNLADTGAGFRIQKNAAE